MIENVIKNETQLAATLDYIAKWADVLEGMRRNEVERSGGVFPTLAAGPLQEIRANIEVARAFAHSVSHVPPGPSNSEMPGIKVTA
jgi:hypothetical protein